MDSKLNDRHTTLHQTMTTQHSATADSLSQLSAMIYALFSALSNSTFTAADRADLRHARESNLAQGAALYTLH